MHSEVVEKDSVLKVNDADISVPVEGNVDNTILDNIQDSQGGARGFESEEQQVRRCTRTGVLINLENARKKTKNAGMAVITSINCNVLTL